MYAREFRSILPRCGRATASARITLCLLLVSPATALGAEKPSNLAQHFDATWDAFVRWLAVEFEQTPAIVLGVGLAFAIPPLALLGVLISRWRRTNAPFPTEPPRSIPISGWKSRGLLVVANSRGEVHEVGLGLVRIGREEDNDVQLMHNTVHRYHAIVERTSDAEFYVMDVSGADGNGVRVDGERVERARLRGGELIEIGKERLRFQLAPAEG